MTNHYHDPADMALMKQMKELAPVEFKAWVELNKISSREDGAIPKKYRELICLALAHATQSPVLHRSAREGSEGRWRDAPGSRRIDVSSGVDDGGRRGRARRDGPEAVRPSLTRRA